MRQSSARPTDTRGTTPAQRRGWWPANRRTVWTDHGGRELADVLDQLDRDAQRVYLCGPRPGGDAPGFRAWLSAGPPPGWTVGSHYLRNPATPTLRFVRPDGSAVVLLRSASWWGETDQPAAVQSDAAELLRRQLVRSFWQQLDGGARRGLLDTPATTGRALMLSAMPFELSVPQLPDDVRDLIRSTTTQGRWQQWSPPAGHDGELPQGISAYDLRFAYAAMCRELPGRFLGHTDRPGDGFDLLDQSAFAPGGQLAYARCRVRIVGTVPDGWWGHGVVPVLAEDHQPDACDDCQRTTSAGTGSTCWPSAPGASFDTWVDGSEAALAASVGWRFRVAELLEWERAKPLDGWAEKLAEVRELLADQWRDDVSNRPAVKLAAAGARMLLLQGIGALHGTASRVHGVADSPADVPEDAAVELLPDGSIEWTAEQRSSWSAMDRPEWSAAVWGRCRARIAYHRPQGSGLLTVEPSALVAVRQDALYLAGGTPVSWSDDGGRVGWLRPVPGDSIAGPCRWPTSAAELLDLKTRNQ